MPIKFSIHSILFPSSFQDPNTCNISTAHVSFLLGLLPSSYKKYLDCSISILLHTKLFTSQGTTWGPEEVKANCQAVWLQWWKQCVQNQYFLRGRRTTVFPCRWSKATIWIPPSFLALTLHRLQNQRLVY